MLSLSSQYAAATSEAQRSVLLAAGHLMTAAWTGTAFDAGYIAQGAALLLFSLAMLRSTLYSRFLPYLGTPAGGMMLLSPTAGRIGMILGVGSVLPPWIWCILIAKRFLRLQKALQ